MLISLVTAQPPEASYRVSRPLTRQRTVQQAGHEQQYRPTHPNLEIVIVPKLSISYSGASLAQFSQDKSTDNRCQECEEFMRRAKILCSRGTIIHIPCN